MRRRRLRYPPPSTPGLGHGARHLPFPVEKRTFPKHRVGLRLPWERD